MDTVHASEELLGRRAVNHPPGFDPTGLTSEQNDDINCHWCRSTLGLAELPTQTGVKVREWTVVTCIDGVLDQTTVDADTIELNGDLGSIKFLRDGAGVFGAPLVRIAYWFAEDVQLEKDLPAS